MSGIFGCLNLPAQELLPRMDAALAHWGPDGNGLWQDDHCGLGQRLLFNTPEALHERLPRWVEDARIAFTAEARIDNRAELCDLFAIPHNERPTTPDSDLILRAYLKWGEESPDHLIGDWSFAVWHPDERKLFIARDHHGNTSLVYWQEGGRFAFASDPKALYAMGAPRRLNELYLAQVLIVWSAYHGSQTIDLDIQRLPPAHAMTVTPQRTQVWRYWRLEDTPELRLPSREEYVAGFLEVYDRAVRDRLRSHRPIGVTLSGGLDSGSVTALAARALGEQGKRLTAFTAVPLYDTSQTVGPKRFGDETEFASLTAAHWPNVDHHLLNSAHITPIQGIRRNLAVMPEPAHAAGNFFWITDLLDQAQARGLGTLLTGQGGNATVSWTGAPELRSPSSALRHSGWKAAARLVAPAALLRAHARWRQAKDPWVDSAIHPAFAARLDLARQQVAAIGRQLDAGQAWRTPQQKRYAIIQPGRSLGGGFWARWGAAAGLEVRDPTVDVRVMAYTLAVPDAIFQARDGLDRALLRQALAGLLPDAVRLNPRRGRQSADLVARLQAAPQEMDAALDQVCAEPAAAYIDPARLRNAWQTIQQEISQTTIKRAVTVLTRGLHAGFFLQGEFLGQVGE